MKLFSHTWSRFRQSRFFTKTIYIKVPVPVPTIVAFKNFDGTNSDIYNERLYGKLASEKSLYYLTQRINEEACPELFKAFDVLKKHNLDVTFFIDTQIFKNQ
jgi:hypothetical protein